MREQDRYGVISAHIVFLSAWFAVLTVLVRWVS